MAFDDAELAAMVAKSKRSSAAARRRNTGEWFEELIESWANVYAMRKVAQLTRVGPLVSMTGPSTARVIRRGPVDFLGAVRAYPESAISTSSHPVAFDAKVLEAGAATFKYDPRQAHQLDYLYRHHAVAPDGVAGLLVARRHPKRPLELRVWWLPYHELPSAQKMVDVGVSVYDFPEVPEAGPLDIARGAPPYDFLRVALAAR